MPSVWTEQNVGGIAVGAERQAQRAAQNLTHAQIANNELQTSQPNVAEAVQKTGLQFQEALARNPMENINKNTRDFAAWCKIRFQHYPGTEFSVLLLADDPSHYDVSRTLQVGKAPTQPKQYFAKAVPIKIETRSGALYTLRIKIYGAKVSELLKTDPQGLALAAAVSTRTPTRMALQDALGGKCAGSAINGLNDIAHIGPVLPLLQGLRDNNGAVANQLTQVKGNKPLELADVAHTHGVSLPDAQQTSLLLINDSTALNPLTSSPTGEDIFTVNPMLTDHVIIIPIWSELENKKNLENSTNNLAPLASVALGTAATFSPQELEKIVTRLITPSNRGKQVSIDSIQHKLSR